MYEYSTILVYKAFVIIANPSQFISFRKQVPIE